MARARLLCILRVDESLVDLPHRVDYDSLAQQLEVQRNAGEYDPRLGRKRARADMGDKALVKNKTNASMVFLREVGLYGSFIEREIVESRMLNIVPCPDEYKDQVEMCTHAVVAYLIKKTNGVSTMTLQEEYHKFIAQRRILACDRMVFWSRNPNDQKSRKALHVLTNKNLETLGLPPMNISKLMETEGARFVDFMFHYESRNSAGDSYVDVLLSQGWYERPPVPHVAIFWSGYHGKFFAVVKNDWTATQGFDNVIQAFVALKIQKRIPRTLTNSGDGDRSVSMTIFDEIISKALRGY
jgi:hypothetical protein